ncbi:GntR family transcriptional regulator [Eubacterium barkeri]|uniref:DNA-binding transcriptional regulator, GntR family n=1 Tax=Eubacterium barkeri TaxID=1528 RepID=A0A1H3AN88_EUBBA|nr:GntR family transcriptional regulator [Eubacterium barkeri]SDX31200.1 DNA-binding transcriptional regulator, GntR family [Eubacterium barkeri]
MSSQSAIAFRKIKDMIFHMELLPGRRISEPQISAKLSISRTPIHDALRQLASEGLVTIGPNRGAVVTEFTDEQIQEIGTIRLSQDILSAKLAAYYGSAADFEQLNRLAEDCEAAAGKGDIYHRITADNAFHLEIARISGNAQLHKQQYALYQQIHLIQISKYTDIEDSLVQIYHHQPIIQAIRMGDLTQASQLICTHVKDFYHIDPYLMKCYGYTEADVPLVTMAQ